MHIGNYGVIIHSQLGLNGGQSVVTSKESTERTLKTLRILLRSDFHPPIASLSLFAWRNRETAYRPLCFVIFHCISLTVLQSRAWWVERLSMCIGASAHVVN